MSLRKILASGFRYLGYEIKRYSIQNSEELQFQAMLDHFGVDTVLDVGANEGQFGLNIRRTGYAGTIISFEPMSDVWNKLKICSENDGRWIVAPRMAIGDYKGNIDINISRNSQSSSILPILPMHTEAIAESVYSDIEGSQIDTLDNAARAYCAPSSVVFIKIDTQGYEDKVLDGAASILATARGVQIELSLVHLYEGQKLWGEIMSRLEKMGFRLWSISPVFADPVTGRMLQVDATFYRV